MGKYTKRDILEFIRERRAIHYLELCDRFGYTPSWASRFLSELKKRKLVINMPRGQWVLTEKGFERLEYYEQKQNTKKRG
jgi:Mn-dependent DtxR family transcriptional regulator